MKPKLHASKLVLTMLCAWMFFPAYSAAQVVVEVEAEPAQPPAAEVSVDVAPPPPQQVVSAAASAPAEPVIVVAGPVQEEVFVAEHDPMAIAPRLRYGWAYELGTLAGNGVGISTSATGRLGVQLNDYFALFYQMRPIIGLLIADDTVQGLAAIYNTVVFETTFLDFIQVAVGAGLDYGAFGYCDATTSAVDGSSTTSCGSVEGAAFGFDTRIGFALGGWDGYQGEVRNGLSLGVVFHPTFVEDRFISTIQLTIGQEWF